MSDRKTMVLRMLMSGLAQTAEDTPWNPSPDEIMEALKEAYEMGADSITPAKDFTVLMNHEYHVRTADMATRIYCELYHIDDIKHYDNNDRIEIAVDLAERILFECRKEDR